MPCEPTVVPEDEHVEPHLSEDDGALYLRLQLASLHYEKSVFRRRIYEMDVEEARLAAVWTKAYPGQAFRPAVTWDSLTDCEKQTTHFIAVRGNVRKVRSQVREYMLETGDVVTPEAWAVRLSRLKDKGVLDRDGRGWRICSYLLADALAHADPYGTTAKAGMERLLAATWKKKRKAAPRTERLTRLGVFR